MRALFDHSRRPRIAQWRGLGQTELIMRGRCSANTTPAEQAGEESPPEAATSDRPTVDEMGEASFPASDPPATWTWDPVQDVDNG
jgi:hypothetical protein